MTQENFERLAAADCLYGLGDPLHGELVGDEMCLWMAMPGSGHSQRHAELRPDSQTFADCIGDVRLSLGLRLPLADAAWYRGALANIHAVFVLIDADNEFHASSHFSPSLNSEGIGSALVPLSQIPPVPPLSTAGFRIEAWRRIHYKRAWAVYSGEENSEERTRLEMPNHSARILVVDDEVNQRSALGSVVTRWGYQVETASDGAEALVKLKDFDADVVITDLNMPNLDGKGLLEELQKLPSPPPAIVLTAFGNLETALETVHQLGAFWFIEKPLQPQALKMVVERALDRRRLATHAGRLERELASRGVLGDLIGESASMQEIFALLQQAAPTKATILITGESGTGKEIVARAIHQISPRRSGPFFAVNCAAMPESLIESELFGHEKGAFTGAVERRAGCFELARGGTLLLDEIGDMPMNTQAKLLRILEESRVRRLGSAREIELDVRVLASTNKNLRRRHRQRRVSRRPVLPPQRLRGPPAAAAGKEGGYPAAGARAAVGL